ncbi:DNA-cytosine methyltransferase [Yersinia pseudotuberculosis]|uniref:DNA cytosine methyltransferase n=1 Tax=Yersinia pseudotuberculosis TaxID=633 RepID=UPI0005DBB495|nr:DNA (cytosine-5-)-methyltransferase [Yersinia pseudotuberculosis]CNK54738.1 DNA-cytosine methyltransferase [Yersinia pseudotuberculosis]
MSTNANYRTSLRLTNSQYCDITRQCQVDGGKIKMSAWITQAINEKIQRDSEHVKLHTELFVHPGRRFYEFFAGGGMARAGLGEDWDCLFANDFNPMKGHTYRDNWNDGEDLLVEDINNITSGQLPEQADLVWASFPCQDLSLAGGYKGIGNAEDGTQTRSGTFWPFWQLMRNLITEERAPKIIVLENVYGVMTSNKGKDFASIGTVFSDAGYRFGAMVIDARHFVPQSRPRVFIVGVHPSIELPDSLTSSSPIAQWHPDRMFTAYKGLSEKVQQSWIWWNLPLPEDRTVAFVDLIDENPEGVKWDSAEKTERLLGMMTPSNLLKVQSAQKAGKLVVGGLYKRTRQNENGEKVQRAEVRFDGIAGCLRTPAGGSSRQSILVVQGNKIRSRLLSPREAARLMGLPDTYKLPNNYNDAYHIAGDGVVVPVVRHLAKFIFEPILTQSHNIASAQKKVA